MSRTYQYRGPHHIAQAAEGLPAGQLIRSVGDFERWRRDIHQQPDESGLIEATFVITEAGALALADRRSEHVACAGGAPVRSAGEIWITRGAAGWEAREISNQSTGYCPEPESWPAVAAALEQIPLAHPGSFTQTYLFRRCPACQQLNLIKDDVFDCAVCDAPLPHEWNCSP